MIRVNPRKTNESIYFPDGGYCFLKNEYFSVAIPVIDTRVKVKRGHIHLDVGSIILSYKGVPFLVDPGTYTYTRDLNQRKKYISDKTHNVLSVRNEEFGYTRVPGFFGVEVDNRMNITQKSDTSISFNHVYYGEQIEISVSIEGETVFIRGYGGNKLESFLHLDPEVKITEVSGRKTVLKNGKYRAEIAASVPLTGENYEFSPGYGIRQEAERIISRGTNMLDIQFIFT